MTQSEYNDWMQRWDPVLTDWKGRIFRVQFPLWGRFYDGFENTAIQANLSAAATQISRYPDFVNLLIEFSRGLPASDGTILLQTEKLIKYWNRIALRPGLLPVLSSPQVSQLNILAAQCEAPIKFASNGGMELHDRMIDLIAYYQPKS